MYNKILLLVLIALSTACASTKPSIDFGNKDGVAKGLTNASDRTIRYVSKVEVGRFLCAAQSERHNDQRMILQQSPVIVMVNPRTGSPEVAIIPESQMTIVYDSKTAPFDMINCLTAMNKNPFERLASKFISEVGVPLIKYGAGYGMASKAFKYLSKRDSIAAESADNAAARAAETNKLLAESAGTKVTGDNNRVVAGDDNVYDEAGGIPTAELTFTELDLNQPEPEEEEDPEEEEPEED